MTKVEAIEKCLIDAGGAASLKDIYEHIEKHYSTAKSHATGMRDCAGYSIVPYVKKEGSGN